MKICWVLVFATFLFDRKTDSLFSSQSSFTNNQGGFNTNNNQGVASIVSPPSNNQNPFFPQSSFSSNSQTNAQGSSSSGGFRPPTTGKPTPRKECCSVLPNLQRDCGYPGITEAACNLRGCCFSPRPENKFWCFQPNVEPCRFVPPPTSPKVPVVAAPAPTQATGSTASSCGIINKSRKQCGVNGIPRAQCIAQQCCFDDRALDDRTRCFFSKLNAPKLTKWSKWTSCPSVGCVGKTRKRTRSCVYVDGKQAPTNFCNDRVEQTENCKCGNAGSGSVSATSETCKDGATTCKGFKSLCDSSESFRNTLCPETCGTCSKVTGNIKVAPAPNQKPTKTVLTPKPAPTKPAKVCKDVYESCSHPDILQDCGKMEHREELRKYCPVSCNLCDEPEVKECKDKYPTGCKERKKACTEGKPAEIKSMRRVCPVTCNSCGETTSNIQPVSQPVTECKDRVDTCYDSISSCMAIGEVGDAARQNCPFTCRRCPGQTPFTSTAAPTTTWQPFTPRQQLTSTAAPTTWRPFTTRQQLTLPPPQPPILPGPALPECKDKTAGCKSLKDLCLDQSDPGKLMRSSCKATCDLCPKQPIGIVAPVVTFQPPATFGPPATFNPPATFRPAATFGPFTTRPPARTLTPQSQIINQQTTRPCVDDLEDGVCEKYKYLCPDPASYWPDLCCLTCKNAGITGTTIPPPPATNSFTTKFVPASVAPQIQQADCVDMISACPDSPDLCDIPQSGWAQSCKKTCGTCGPGSVQKLAPATVRPQTPQTFQPPGPQTFRPPAQTFRPPGPQTFPTAPPVVPTKKMQLVATTGCQNLLLECEDYKYLCNEPTSTWKEECPVTCNSCSGQRVVQPTAQPKPQTPRPAQPAKTPKSDCKENESWCRGKETSCFSKDQSVVKIMSNLCPITCGLCVRTEVKVPVTARPVVVTTATTAPQPDGVAVVDVGGDAQVQVIQPDVVCEDQYPACSEQVKVCTTDDADARKTMRRVCPVTCGSCNEIAVAGPVEIPPPSGCVDQFEECPTEKPKCTDQQATVRDTMRKYCPVTCNLCDSQLQPVAVAPVVVQPQPVVVAPASQVQRPASGSVAAAVDTKCEDSENWCAERASACNSGDKVTRDTVRSLCPATCKTCPSGVVNVAAPAVNPTENTFAPQPVAPAASEYIWTEWSSCSVTCGAGSQKRGQICLQSGPSCEFKEESRICNLGACPAPQPVVDVGTGSVGTGGTGGGACENLVVGDWCDSMKKRMKIFCENDNLSKSCLKTCGKC